MDFNAAAATDDEYRQSAFGVGRYVLSAIEPTHISNRYRYSFANLNCESACIIQLIIFMMPTGRLAHHQQFYVIFDRVSCEFFIQWHIVSSKTRKRYFVYDDDEMNRSVDRNKLRAFRIKSI